MFCSRSIRAMCCVWLWIVGGAPISPVVSCHFSTSLGLKWPWFVDKQNGQRGRRAVGMKENECSAFLWTHPSARLKYVGITIAHSLGFLTHITFTRHTIRKIYTKSFP
ncbi:hypothetical protein EDB85DRAFT_2000562 [Lactarius pseudohatsudake]|nr:hypothetical protein EDB85DRAFT_2000562 [Lactarius pseudohatsudake]